MGVLTRTQCASLRPANKENAAGLKHHATSRFRRSIHWCTQLLSQCQSLYATGRLSAENVLEINAYTLILSGRFLRFREEYEDSLDQLCVARDILDKLAECAESSRNQALATLFSDEISPEIRYCAHQMGQQNSYDIERIVAEVAPKQCAVLVPGYDQIVDRVRKEGKGEGGLESRKRLREVVWEGEPVPIRNPELVDVLLEVQKAEDLLKSDYDASQVFLKEDEKLLKQEKKKHDNKSRKGVAAFDAILAALSDAEEVARKLSEAQKVS